MGLGKNLANTATRKSARKADASSLLKHPDLWRAGQLGRAPDTLTSGFSQLDAHLPGNGWPRAGLGEFLLSTAGVGELRLLGPLLKHVSHTEARWIVWVNPPFIPYAPALSALGVDISKILLIHPRDHNDALWALERASKSGTCSVALGWLDEQKLNVKDTRRLQLAARQGHTFTCLFRPEQAAAQNSMAELRLQVRVPLHDELHEQLHEQPAGELEVSIIKRRGGWPVSGLRLSVSDARNPVEVREQLSLWRRMQQGRQNQRVDHVGSDYSEAAGHVPDKSRQPAARITH